MLDPVTLDRCRARRRAPPRHDPGRGQVALLAEVRAQDPDVEILTLDSSKPPVEHPERRVDGDRLMVVGWDFRSDRSRVAAVLPEQGSDTGPVPLR